MKRLILALAVAVGLTACSTTPDPGPPGGPSNPPIATPPGVPRTNLTIEAGKVLLDGAVLEATRALTLTGLALDTVQALAIRFVERDLLPPPALRSLDVLNQRASEVVLRGYQAQTEAERMAAAVELLTIRNSISTLLLRPTRRAQ